MQIEFTMKLKTDSASCFQERILAKDISKNDHVIYSLYCF